MFLKVIIIQFFKNRFYVITLLLLQIGCKLNLRDIVGLLNLVGFIEDRVFFAPDEGLSS
jgi:hypothetical protein